MWLLVAFTIAAATLGLYITYTWNGGDKDHKRIPGPWFLLPLIGETVALGVQGPLKFMHSRYLKYGPIFRTNLLNQPMVVVGDPAMQRAIYASPHMQQNVPVYNVAELMGDMRHMHDLHRHKLFRKYQSTSFNSNVYQEYLPKMEKIASRHLQTWAQQGTVDLSNAVREVLLDFVLDVIVDFPLASTDRRELCQLITTFMQGLFAAPFALPGTPLSRARAAKKKLMQLIRQELPRLLQQHQLETQPGACPENHSSKQQVEGKDRPQAAVHSPLPERAQPNLLDAILAEIAAADELYHDYVVERVLQAVFAASETTINQLLAVLVLVAQDEAVLSKLREEQEQVQQQFGASITGEALAAMQYADAVVREAARMCPATHLLFRRATADVQCGGYTIRKDTVVALSVEMAHFLDPCLADDAPHSTTIPPALDLSRPELSFKPDRWLHDTSRPKGLMTWGSGRHLCLGMNLALLEMKLLLALLLRGYEWRGVRQYKLEAMPQPHVRNGRPLFRVGRRAAGV